MKQLVDIEKVEKILLDTFSDYAKWAFLEYAEFSACFQVLYT